MHTACMWSEKLPFAGYSVFKDHLLSAAGRHVAFATPDSVGPWIPLRPFLRNLLRYRPRRNASNPTLTHRRRLQASLGCRAPGERAARQSRGVNLGGEYRARTGDLLVANQALSQLS